MLRRVALMCCDIRHIFEWGRLQSTRWATSPFRWGSFQVGEQSSSANVSSARNHDRFLLARITRFSTTVVREESAIVVGLTPMIEMDLIEGEPESRHNRSNCTGEQARISRRKLTIKTSVGVREPASVDSAHEAMSMEDIDISRRSYPASRS